MLTIYQNNRTWIRLTIKLFLIAALFGVIIFFVNPKLLLTIIESFQSRFGTKPALDFHLVIQIFLQNLLVSAIALFGGMILGLTSLSVIFVNGFLIGFVVASIFSTSSNFLVSLALILGGIVPHGIFELPAFLFAAALGLRLGWEWMKKGSVGKRRQVFKTNLIQSLWSLPLIAAVLFIAAIIEVFVSGKIVDKF